MAATTLTDRALIRLTGEGVRDFLQGLVTSNVVGDLPVWTGLLTPQGKCLFDFFVWADGEDILLDCESDQVDALARRLTLYRLRRQIGIARDETLAVHWSPEGEEDPRMPALGKRWLGEPGEPANGYHEHRLRLGVCEGTAELGDLLWLETNAAELNGVDFKKGCFVGQENTARMNWRQKINRRLFVVEGDGEGLKVRAHYPDLGLTVVHGRAAEPPEGALLPDWLKAALPA